MIARTEQQNECAHLHVFPWSFHLVPHLIEFSASGLVFRVVSSSRGVTV
jgi:hypothetical protein